ncbi:carboxyl-terminal processing protease [Kushneria sinocarnis]|uniref:Carboxyl-terminal processing protease n=1 Tax=Kushneria sinocarnis TaxID=595502 RepID=A0A420X0G7_9GAMM|nr:S41 family peptidase [Kushneria sinocarnis]RKR07348.1 carboxyl-terminal processing protease [Kushneria sinocarnis]
MRARRTPLLLMLSLAPLALQAPAWAETDTPAEMPADAAPQGETGTSVELDLDDVRTFAEVFERIKRTYVDQVDDATLLRNAMRGMLSGLDPHSAYLDREDFEQLQEATEGEFSGIGIQIGEEEGRLTVIAPIDDTPAARAGLQPHDRILAIDGTATDGMSLEDAVDRLRGDAGTPVTLTIIHEGAGEPREVTLERAEISSRSVSSRMLAPGYGYLRISQFQTRTADQAREAIASLRGQGEQPLQGVILDLRNNPGGILDGAVDVADLFLGQGLIVYTKGRLPDSRMSFSAHADTPLADTPMVVLINGGTASAAEIVSGALQNHHRAIVMGSESFGKGSVQSVMPLDNGTGLKLTTALYYTPDGRSIQAEGIVPDVDVQQGHLEIARSAGLRIRESDLSGHLQNARDRSRPESSQATPVAGSDYQLGEALNLLRGLNALHQRDATHDDHHARGGSG